MAEPHVTVVMPAYNAAPFVAEAIDSVLNQSYTNARLVVVDDGSTDSTPDIVRAYSGLLTYIRQENQGQASARNRGASEGSSELVAFIDADDIWLREKLARQVALLRSTREPAALVYCGVETLGGQGVSAKRPAWVRGEAREAILLREVGGGICGSTFLLQRDLFEALEGFDRSLVPCEDTDLLWRAACRAQILYIEEPLVRYRLHPGNAHANLARMHAAWRRFYWQALRSPPVRERGRLFAARCRGRLNYMLAGENLGQGAIAAAFLCAARALLWWPPLAFKMARRMTLAAGGWR